MHSASNVRRAAVSNAQPARSKPCRCELNSEEHGKIDLPFYLFLRIECNRPSDARLEVLKVFRSPRGAAFSQLLLRVDPTQELAVRNHNDHRPESSTKRGLLKLRFRFWHARCAALPCTIRTSGAAAPACNGARTAQSRAPSVPCSGACLIFCA
eukprot:6177062-Pleurochrysis_carterae.AAC.2